jgi:hypothetical protein
MDDLGFAGEPAIMIFVFVGGTMALLNDAYDDGSTSQQKEQSKDNLKMLLFGIPIIGLIYTIGDDYYSNYFFWKGFFKHTYMVFFSLYGLFSLAAIPIVIVWIFKTAKNIIVFFKKPK